jgi:hypothetical protein
MGVALIGPNTAVPHHARPNQRGCRNAGLEENINSTSASATDHLASRATNQPVVRHVHARRVHVAEPDLNVRGVSMYLTFTSPARRIGSLAPRGKVRLKEYE